MLDYIFEVQSYVRTLEMMDKEIKQTEKLALLEKWQRLLVIRLEDL